MINSFVISRIMADFDGSEDDKFNFPTYISEYIDDNMDNQNNNIIIEANNQSINLPNINEYMIKLIKEEVINENKDILHIEYDIDILEENKKRLLLLSIN